MREIGRTPTRQNILNFIIAFREENGFSPTVREICQGVGVKSTSTVLGHLRRMQRDLLITMNPKRPRSICPLRTPDGKEYYRHTCVLSGLELPATDSRSGLLLLRDAAGKMTGMYEVQDIQIAG